MDHYKKNKTEQNKNSYPQHTHTNKQINIHKTRRKKKASFKEKDVVTGTTCWP